LQAAESIADSRSPDFLLQQEAELQTSYNDCCGLIRGHRGTPFI